MTIEALQKELENERAARIAAESQLEKLNKRVALQADQSVIDENNRLSALVAENENADANQNAQKKFYEQILNNIPADVAVFSPDHRYLFLNPVANKDPELRAWMIGKSEKEYC